MTPKTDYSAWRFYLDLGQYIVAGLVALYVYISNRAKATEKDVKKVKECVDNDVKGVERSMNEIANRVTALESSIITKDELSALYDRVNGMASQVDNMTGKLDTAINSWNIAHEYLLNKGDKA